MESNIIPSTLTMVASPTEQEQIMRGVWAHLLSLEAESITSTTNFFDIGGNSLTAAELTLIIKKNFEVQLMVKDIYAYPTLAELLNYITHHDETAPLQATFLNDTDLDPTIVPAPTRKPDSLMEAQTLFLTGSTGFLGGFILEALLRESAPDSRIHCLVRVKTGQSQDGLKRIISNLKQYNLWKQQYESRIVPVVGDLAQPLLGLSPEAFAAQAETVDMIFHAGAWVNYIYDYEVLKPSVVSGTGEVLRLACTHTTKPLHYISSNGVFPGDDPEPYLENRQIEPYGEHLTGGYCPAKWVAENLVWHAHDRHLPVCIYRPGNIGHDSRSGVVNPNDFQFMIIDACVKIGAAPDKERWAFEMTPVDYLAQAIVRGAIRPQFGQVYNAVQNEPTLARTIFDLLAERGHISRFISLEQWKAELFQRAEQDGDYVLNVLAQSIDEVESFLDDSSIYDCTQFEQTATANGIPHQLADVAYFKTFLNATYHDEGKKTVP